MKPFSLWLYRICAALIPAIYLLFFYTQNTEWLNPAHVAILSLLFCGGSLVLFWIFRFISKSHLAAFGALSWFWAAFWGCNTLRQVPEIYRNAAIVAFFLIVFVVWAAILFFLRRIKNQDTPALFVAELTGVLLVLNLVSLLAVGTQPNVLDETRFKQEFTVDASLPTPNVYWFHCDGMLGFDGMEHFFGDPQTAFTQALADRGFSVNRSANFEGGHSTSIAVPVLMCPYFYDTELSFAFNPEYAFGRKGEATPEKYIPPKVSHHDTEAARERNELVHAFIKRSYHVSVIDLIAPYFYPWGDRFYDMTNEAAPLLQTKSGDPALMRYFKVSAQAYDLFLLAVMNTPLRLFWRPIKATVDRLMFYKEGTAVFQFEEIPQRVDFKNFDIMDKAPSSSRVIMQCLADSIEQRMPRFVLIDHATAHTPFRYDESGNHNTGSLKQLEENIDLYPEHHRYATKILIHYIDLVLERDPDAVIVLQADHGLHGLTLEQIMKSKRCSAEEARLLWNGVISAVRIPQKFGGAPVKRLDPLNIARYLVNHFVGSNYEYVPD